MSPRGPFTYEKNENLVRYYTAVGVLAANLKHLQEKLDKINFDWYVKIGREYFASDESVRKFDCDIKKAEAERKIAEIRSKLVVGVEPVVGKD